MNICSVKQLLNFLLLFICWSASAQNFSPGPKYSGSNRIPNASLQHDWTFGINASSTFAIQKNEYSGFRGNSIGSKLYGRYNFGNLGLGFSGGMLPGNISSAAVNAFLVERKFQQAQVTQSNPSNSYLLFGPSFRFGTSMIVTAEVQAGYAMNNTGTVSIAQQGAVRSLYAFGAGEKNIFPAFSGSVSIAYPINATTRFVLNADYLQTKASILLYDPQRGIDVATKEQRNVRLLSVGVGISKSFASCLNGNATSRSGRRNQEAMAERKGWDGTVKGGSIVDDNPSNKAINQAGIKKNEAVNPGDEAQRKGWDGTVKGGSVVDDNPSNKAINQAGIKKNEAANTGNDAQRKGWDGTVKGGSVVADNTASSIENSSNDTQKDFLIALNELDKLLEADKSAASQTLRQTKENSRQLRASLQTNSVGTAPVEDHYVRLMKSISSMGNSYNRISNVLKTKHDTAKNSVSNIR